MEERSSEEAMSDSDWQKTLSPEAYAVTRQGATERPFTGPHLDNHEDGTYRCVCCGAELFGSDAKFDSGTGWPSFTEPANLANVELIEDRSHGMVRTEVRCRACEAHLGHVFDDGPGPNGQRWCINGCALDFEKA
jgi:peptide-methionine (R)-S-oxide reductase